MEGKIPLDQEKTTCEPAYHIQTEGSGPEASIRVRPHGDRALEPAQPASHRLPTLSKLQPLATMPTAHLHTQHHESIQPPLTHRSPPVYVVSMGEEPTTSQHHAKDGETSVERPHPPSRPNNKHLGGCVFKAGLGHLAKSSLKKRERERKAHPL